MRTIDITGLKSLGRQGLGPWPLDDDHLLRTCRLGHRLTTQEDAQAVFDVYEAAARISSITPVPFEVVRVPDGFGVVVEYIRGVSLVQHLAFCTFDPSEAGAAMAGLLRQFHANASRCDVGRDHHARFRTWATSLAALLPQETGSRLVSLVGAIDNPHTLLHGDPHMGNAIVLKDDLSLIDLEFGGFGHPVLDLAIARSRIVHNLKHDRAVSRLLPGGSSIDVEKVIDTLWDALIERYFEGVDARTRERAWRPGSPSSRRSSATASGSACPTETPRTSTKGQRAHLARCERLMGELLPGIERLDFS